MKPIYDTWNDDDDNGKTMLVGYSITLAEKQCIDELRAEHAKMRECLEWLQKRHHGGLMRAKIDQALSA